MIKTDVDNTLRALGNPRQKLLLKILVAEDKPMRPVEVLEKLREIDGQKDSYLMEVNTYLIRMTAGGILVKSKPKSQKHPYRKAVFYAPQNEEIKEIINKNL
jgi:hypothetical protein